MANLKGKNLQKNRQEEQFRTAAAEFTSWKQKLIAEWESSFRLGLAWASVRDGLQSIATDAFEIFEFRCGPWHAGHFAVPDAWVAVLMPMQALLITKMTVAVPRLEVGLCTHWHATRA